MMKKNILIILPWLPYPTTSGGNKAMFNGILAIKDYYRTHVLYVDNSKVKKNIALKEISNKLDYV